MLPTRLITAVIAAAAFSLTAQPRLVKDINVSTSPVSSSPVALDTIGNLTYFYAHEPQTGYELWKTDGTEGGTTIVRDLFPGPSSGIEPDYVAAVPLGNRLIFVGTDGLAWGFWATDGTAQGTVRLGDASAINFPSLGPVIGSTFYFIASRPDSQARELWRTDGTPAGTRAVLDRNTALGKNGMAMIAPLGSLLLLSGFDDTNFGLFTTDGTAEGTRFVAPFSPPTGVSLGDKVLFVHRPDATGVRLMRTDGTAAGTIAIRGGFSRITGFQVMNGVAYFAGTDPVNGTELWRSDGTVEGTALVADVTPGAAASQTLVPQVFGNRLLFTAAGNLWISDGTAAGTHVVKAVPYVSGGAVHGNHFYFVSEEPASGRELWKTDGTAAGTTLVFDVDPGPRGSIDSAQLVARPDGVFFPASDRISGREPWITDGTSAGTRLLKNVAPEIRNGSYPEALANVGGRLVFQASGQVWTSDGTAEGTSALTVPGLNVEKATASGGLYYFVNDDLPALQLWRTDGTVPGTFRLFTMGDARFFDGMTPLSGGLYVAGSDPAHGVEPWFTDGTVAGTRLLKDIDPGTSNGFVHTSSAHEVEAGTLAFLGEGEDGNEIWLTDGTPANTRRLMRLERHAWSILPSAFTKFGDAIYFLGVRQGEPLTLWKADAVTGDFAAVHQVPGQLYWTAIWKVGDAMLFTAGDELWRSDGTEAGTVMVRDGLPGPECINLQNFVVGDGLLYWYGHAGNVPELWRSDGTAAGTFRLGTLMEAGSCRPRHFHYSDGRLYFAGRDDLYGSEPWVTDGTLMGTRLLADVNPGPDSSGPDSFMRIGRTLYFAANLPSTGRELWAIETGCAGECRSRRRSIRH